MFRLFKLDSVTQQSDSIVSLTIMRPKNFTAVSRHESPFSDSPPPLPYPYRLALCSARQESPSHVQPRAPDERQPLPEITPIPRKYRHDGWMPERQEAFFEALADCGSVTRAVSQVNMAQANCYTLRRAPGAESFRKAWDAALDFRVKRLKEGRLFARSRS